MIRFLYGCVCLVALLILGASLTGWVYSDRVPAGDDAKFASYTRHLRNYAVEGRHAHGLATLLAGPDVGDNAPLAMPTTQPIDQMPTRWQLGPAKFMIAETPLGRDYYAQSPYWLLAAVAALPLLLWLALPRRQNPRLCRSCHTNLRGSPAQCKKCGSTFTVAQY